MNELAGVWIILEEEEGGSDGDGDGRPVGKSFKTRRFPRLEDTRKKKREREQAKRNAEKDEVKQEAGGDEGDEGDEVEREREI